MGSAAAREAAREAQLSTEFVAAFKARAEQTRAIVSQLFPRDLSALVLAFAQRLPHRWQPGPQQIGRTELMTTADGLSITVVHPLQENGGWLYSRTISTRPFGQSAARCWSVVLPVYGRREVSVLILRGETGAVVMCVHFREPAEGEPDVLRCEQVTRRRDFSFDDVRSYPLPSRKMRERFRHVDHKTHDHTQTVTLSFWVDLARRDVYVAIDGHVVGRAIIEHARGVLGECIPAVDSHDTNVTLLNHSDFGD